MSDTNDAASYGDLLAAALNRDIEWSDRDLGEILSHLLTGSLVMLVPDVIPAKASETIEELLNDPRPSSEALMRLKSYAKSCRAEEDGQLPKPIATVLYFASLAASRVRCGRTETQLEAQSMCEGFRWVEACEWVTPELRRLAKQAGDVTCQPAERR